MPNRIIKESIRTSKKVNALSDFQFRLWTYLITYVDDYGRGSADPEIIKGFVFPRRKRVSESDIQKTLAELADIGCILLYEVDGESYFCFPNWGEHQRVQTKKSKFPAPDDKNTISPWVTVNHGDSPPESNPNPNTNPNPNIYTAKAARAPKHKFGEFGNVLLTDAEYEKLQKEYGNADELIAFLSEYIERKGYKAKSHYLTIKKWVIDAVKEQKNKRPENGFISSNTDYDQIEQMLKGEKIWD